MELRLNIIPTGTTNIVLTCSLPECICMKSDESGVTTIDNYIIPEISECPTVGPFHWCV